MVQIPKHIIEGGKVREVTLTKDNLINFEKEVKQKYNDGEIKAPVHLSSNNEEQLIEIFQYVVGEIIIMHYFMVLIVIL